jgi:phospholipase/carboxylesterase
MFYLPSEFVSHRFHVRDFIAGASARYSFSRTPIAIGYSNGAIMAAALLLTRPGLLAGAVLLRPVSPFWDDLPTRLGGGPVLTIDGEMDSRRKEERA